MKTQHPAVSDAHAAFFKQGHKIGMIHRHLHLDGKVGDGHAMKCHLFDGGANWAEINGSLAAKTAVAAQTDAPIVAPVINRSRYFPVASRNARCHRSSCASHTRAHSESKAFKSNIWSNRRHRHGW